MVSFKSSKISAVEFLRPNFLTEFSRTGPLLVISAYGNTSAQKFHYHLQQGKATLVSSSSDVQPAFKASFRSFRIVTLVGDSILISL